MSALQLTLLWFTNSRMFFQFQVPASFLHWRLHAYALTCLPFTSVLDYGGVGMLCLTKVAKYLSPRGGCQSPQVTPLFSSGGLACLTHGREHWKQRSILFYAAIPVSEAGGGTVWPRPDKFRMNEQIDSFLYSFCFSTLLY